MPGAFEASFERDFEGDPLKTADEIQSSGADAHEWLVALAESENPAPVDVSLVQAIHRWWFESTFPVDAGRLRTEIVLNRKNTAVPVEAVLPGLDAACKNWAWRRGQFRPDEDAQLLAFAICEANTLAVAIYDVHPFIDGNTRLTWELRNYVFMLARLPALKGLRDAKSYEEAWWTATPHAHEDLDRALLRELVAQR